jgi:hypothetical protein
MCMPMIRCLSPFKGGTKLPVGNRLYHFLPNESGHAVADVLEQDVDTVLSIGAGYQKYSGQPAPSDDLDDSEGGMPEVFDEPNPAFAQPTDTEFKVGTAKPPRMKRAAAA